MSIKIIDLLFGKPLSTTEERGQRLGPLAGIPVFGLDALSSAAYGPEAGLALLIAFGALGVACVVPITIAIVILLCIVYFSYRQTIEAYPGGGGSYTVAGQNLGEFAGLLAAAALMIDYVLTAAVGISAGVGALVSAVPSLEPQTLKLCLGILVLITLVNLRGVRETGTVFMFPTYLFIATLLGTIVLGIINTIAAGGHPVPVESPPALSTATGTVGAWLLLKAFSSGCTAMTGVEAVSNGVTAFRKPVVKTAQRTLTVIIALLIAMLLGIAFLCRAYHIGATNPGPGYQSLLSQLTAAVAGRGYFYYVTIASILVVLSLSANTAFADFPRLSRLVAQDGFLPWPLAVRGRRLVYTQGIIILAIVCAILLTIFGGVTDRLIPLYAIGAFLAFTMSQAGMVMHWKRAGGRASRTGMFINGLGATATAITVLVVAVTKFSEGAWITVLLIPAIMLSMYGIRRHYDTVMAQLANPSPLAVRDLKAPLIVIPMLSLNKIARKGIEFGLTMSPDIHVISVETTGDNRAELCREWRDVIEHPLQNAGLPVPHLVFVESPYRFVIQPIVDYALKLAEKHPHRQIAVIVPELIQKHWYNYFLHNERATWLKAALLFQGHDRIIVINVPWHMT
jgi:amino acid transporter